MLSALKSHLRFSLPLRFSISYSLQIPGKQRGSVVYYRVNSHLLFHIPQFGFRVTALNSSGPGPSTSPKLTRALLFICSSSLFYSTLVSPRCAADRPPVWGHTRPGSAPHLQLPALLRSSCARASGAAVS